MKSIRLFCSLLLLSQGLDYLGSPDSLRLTPPPAPDYLTEQAIAQPLLVFFINAFDRVQSSALARRLDPRGGDDIILAAVGQGSSTLDIEKLALNGLDGTQQDIVDKSFDFLEDLQRNPPKGTTEFDLELLDNVLERLNYLASQRHAIGVFDAIVRSWEDYLFGFAQAHRVGLPRELFLVTSGHPDQIRVVAELLFHEGAGLVKPEHNRFDHRDLYLGSQRRIFGVENPLKDYFLRIIAEKSPEPVPLGQRQGLPLITLYRPLLQTFESMGLGDYADVSAATFVRLREGSLEKLVQWRVLSAELVEALLASRDQVDHIRRKHRKIESVPPPDAFSEAVQRDLGLSAKHLLDGYHNSGLPASDLNQVLYRMVPYPLFKKLLTDARLTPSYLAEIIFNHSDFDSLIYQSIPLVMEIQDRVGGVTHAWRIVIGHGNDRRAVLDIVTQGEELLPEIEKLAGGKGQAWRFMISNGISETTVASASAINAEQLVRLQSALQNARDRLGHNPWQIRERMRKPKGSLTAIRIWRIMTGRSRRVSLAEYQQLLKLIRALPATPEDQAVQDLLKAVLARSSYDELATKVTASLTTLLEVSHGKAVTPATRRKMHSELAEIHKELPPAIDLGRLRIALETVFEALGLTTQEQQSQALGISKRQLRRLLEGELTRILPTTRRNIHRLIDHEDRSS